MNPAKSSTSASDAELRAALEEARSELVEFIDAWRTGALPATVAAVHLLAAREVLQEVTGGVVLDDVVDLAQVRPLLSVP